MALWAEHRKILDKFKKKRRPSAREREFLRRERRSLVWWDSEIMRNFTEQEINIMKMLRRTVRGMRIMQMTFDVQNGQLSKDQKYLLNEPVKFARDERERLHCMDGPAVIMKNGAEGYFIHGVAIPKDLYWRIIKKTITAREILALRNTEQKAIALRHIGYDRVVKELGAKVVHRQALEHPKFKDRFYELIEVNLGEYGDDGRNTNARFVKVVCHSTGKETILRVPVIRQTETCAGAIAWTFFFDNANTYKPILET